MKTLIILFSSIFLASSVYSQNEFDLAYSPGNSPYTLNSPYNFGDNVWVLPADENYSNVVRNLTTSGYAGYGDVFIPFEERTTTKNDAASEEENINTLKKNWDYEVTYPEGAQLTADDGQEYDTIYFAPFAEFENQSDVVRQTMTSTVEYTTLYIPKGEKDQPEMLVEEDTQLEKVEATSVAYTNIDANIEGMMSDIDISSASNAGYVSPSIDGKVLVITKENGYRYFDNKEVVGKDNLVNELTESGKPISELTFYYMMIDYNIMSESDISANDFLKMDMDEQINLVSPLLNGYANR